MNAHPSVPNTSTISPAPAAKTPVATTPAADPVAHLEYIAVIRKAGLISSPELVEAVAKRHAELLTTKMILQVFMRLKKDEATRRLAQSKEGAKS